MRKRSAFTLVELLTVLIIISILIGILIPTVSHIRRAAYNTGVQAQIASLRQAIDQYYADFHSYPGPVSNQVMGTAPMQVVNAVYNPNYIFLAANVPATPTPPAQLATTLTGPENLVLGLIGGLTYYQGTAASGNYANAGVWYDPSLVGGGSNSLNTGLPKKFGAYIDTGDLSGTFNSTKNGFYSEPGVSSIGDSPVPEILDRFPSKMPILYIRANVGATMYNSAVPPNALSDDVNPVAIDAGSSTYGSNTGNQTSPTNTSNAPVIRYAQYDISQVSAYTQSHNGACIGEGKTPPQYYVNGSVITPPFPYHGLAAPPAGVAGGATGVGVTSVLSQNQATGSLRYDYPYPAYPYLQDPNSPAFAQGPPAVIPYARAKDTYILISAGVDRIYGTADDITSFGDVRP